MKKIKLRINIKHVSFAGGIIGGIIAALVTDEIIIGITFIFCRNDFWRAGILAGLMKAKTRLSSNIYL